MNLVEKLLMVDKSKATERETRKYESHRLKKMTGDGDITLRELSGRKRNSLVAMTMKSDGKPDYAKAYDANLMAVVEGVIVPDLKNRDLMEHFGAATPKDLAEILFFSEVDDIADAIMSIGAAEADEEEVKN